VFFRYCSLYAILPDQAGFTLGFAMHYRLCILFKFYHCVCVCVFFFGGGVGIFVFLAFVALGFVSSILDRMLAGKNISKMKVVKEDVRPQLGQ